MTGLPAPMPGESLVTGDELWWRQCPSGPTYFDEEKGQPTNMMFHWNDADAGMLSGARASASSAEQAYKHRTEVEKKASEGTWGLPAKTAAKVGSQLIDDSANLPAPPGSPPGHTYLDLRHVSNAKNRTARDERERIRARLLLAAKRHHAKPAS